MTQPIQVVADLEFQKDLESIYDKSQTMTCLRKAFDTDVVREILEEAEIPIAFGIDLLCQMHLHKRAKLRVLTGLLNHHFGASKEGLQVLTDTVEKCLRAGIVWYDEIPGDIVVMIEAPDHIQDQLDKFQYPVPCVVPPKRVKTNRDIGYYTLNGSAILKGHNHHDDDICLDHLNRSNRVPLTLNMDTARLIENSWTNLDRQKDDETQEDYQQRLDAFLEYDRNARDVMDLVQVSGNRFWMTHKYDKRGRTYAQGYHINPQGNDWNKAVIEFAEQKLVTDL